MTSDSPFLAAARQGKNSWQRYLLGTVLVFLIPIVAIVAMCIPIVVILLIASIFYPPLRQTLASKNGVEQFLYSRFFGFQFSYFFIIGLFAILFLVTMVFVLEYIHRRRWQTLLGLENHSFSIARVIQGFAVSFGFSLVRTLTFYLTMPSRYTVSFNASEWLIALPFSFLLAIFISLIHCFLRAYWLQGLGLVVQKPARLATLYGLLLGTTFFFSGTHKTPISWFAIVLQFMFLAWIVLKDNRLELLIGSSIGDSLYSLSILGVGSDKIQFPTILKRTSETIPVLNLLIFIIYATLFYFIFFRSKPRHPV